MSDNIKTDGLSPNLRADLRKEDQLLTRRMQIAHPHDLILNLSFGRQSTVEGISEQEGVRIGDDVGGISSDAVAPPTPNRCGKHSFLPAGVA